MGEEPWGKVTCLGGGGMRGEELGRVGLGLTLPLETTLPHIDRYSKSYTL